MPNRKPAAIVFAAGFVVIVAGSVGLLLTRHPTPPCGRSRPGWRRCPRPPAHRGAAAVGAPGPGRQPGLADHPADRREN